jgi:hypothetical protein
MSGSKIGRDVYRLRRVQRRVSENLLIVAEEPNGEMVTSNLDSAVAIVSVGDVEGTIEHILTPRPAR